MRWVPLRFQPLTLLRSARPVPVCDRSPKARRKRGSGANLTTAWVTPPNNTRSHGMLVNINVPADSNSCPAITVDPVGAGK